MKKPGVTTSIVLLTPEALKRRERARRREEARWAAKCGPVTVRFVDPETLRKPK